MLKPILSVSNYLTMARSEDKDLSDSYHIDYKLQNEPSSQPSIDDLSKTGIECETSKLENGSGSIIEKLKGTESRAEIDCLQSKSDEAKKKFT